MVDARPTVGGRVATAIRTRPAAAAGVLLAVVALVRAADVLLLGLHERVGALALSATLALVVSAGALRILDVETAGLSAARSPLVRAALVGVVGVAAVQVVAHALELAALGTVGGEAGLVVAAENPATGSRAAGPVAASLLFGVLVTAVGEELLFRGLVLGTLSGRLSFPWANAAQAALFGAWHFAWPLVLLVSPARPLVPLWLYAVGLFLVTATVGAAFGWLVRATGTLWTAVAAHLLHNGIAVFVHVRTPAGEPRASVLSAALVLGYVLLAWGAWRRFGDANGAASGRP